MSGLAELSNCSVRGVLLASEVRLSLYEVYFGTVSGDVWDDGWWGVAGTSPTRK